MSDHILVSQQLPPDNELVWAYDPREGEGTWRAVQYSHETGIWYDLKNREAMKDAPYTHWMPMPAEEEEQPKKKPTQPKQGDS